MTNGAEPDIDASRPYLVEVTVEGTAAFLFHAWNNEAVAEKGAAAKGSVAKKSDNIESYVYRRPEDGCLGIPGEYLRGAVVNAARFRQDPRSPRKSALDLFKAAVVPMTGIASLGVKDWDYIDQRRAVVQRNAITRHRPALLAGWRATFDLMVMLPQYIEPALFLDVLTDAGRLIGLGDFRPTYGRFQVVSFEVRTG